MATQKTCSRKEEFEAKNPYVIVVFEIHDNKTIATIEKSFTNKKSANKYLDDHCANSHYEVMTRNQYMKNALMCM